MCRFRLLLSRQLRLVVCLLLPAAALLVWLRLLTAKVPDSATTQSAAAERSGLRDREVLIAVRTSGQYHSSRLSVLVDTWLQDHRPSQQVYVFSDGNAVNGITAKLEGVMGAVSRCGQGHSASVLCCRLAHELAVFIDTKHKWLCHFDDDNYVNTAILEAMLASYNPKQPWYIGREMSSAIYPPEEQTITLRYATGGAGFCLSRAALLQAGRDLLHGQLESSCARLGTPDDVSLGYILWKSHSIRLTHVGEFHSHLEDLSRIPSSSLNSQVSLSYSLERKPPNVLSLDGLDPTHDPTRLRSLHCLLHDQMPCL